MTTTYKTPGVYVEEISTLPPSVAEVSTAIPAFLGYTEKGPPIARVSTFLEYQDLFGGADPQSFTVTTAGSNGTKTVQDVSHTSASDVPEHLMYYCLSHYFKNGGGSCYVVSTGVYSDPLAKQDFLDGLGEIEKEDEPTLILLGDALHLTAADYYDVCQQALLQCNKLGDRFAIFDVKDPADPDADPPPDPPLVPVDEFRKGLGTDYLMYGAAYHPYLRTSLNYVYQEDQVTIEGMDSAETLATIKSKETALYNEVKTALTNERVTLPPSAAVAGIYAGVDRDRGVWKAPANVSVSAVIEPVEKITHEKQEELNVDPTGGKSINALRAFTGKGILVWGARTLAGNDNEWRYVSVRRLFNMIEESSRKSTSFAVFEPNDQTTWLKVRGMIESYLYGLWERGALAGSTPEAAYFVHVGLGKTMTAQDVLEGRMIVEIGVAAVRPAEFIILRFSHKLQEA